MKIVGDRANAVRNVGFRGWRRNREKLRNDENEGGRGGSTKTANTAAELSEAEIVAKVAKLQKRKDLIDLGVVSDMQAVREAVVAAGGHVGRAAIAFGIHVATEATVQTPNQHPAGSCLKQSDSPISFDHGQDGLPDLVVLTFRKACHHRQGVLQERQPVVHLQS